MTKTHGIRRMLAWAGLPAAALVALLAMAVGQAKAADDKDKSGRLYTWNVTLDGKQVLGIESLRMVESESGAFYASGELKLKSGNKAHRKSHTRREGGKVTKYQRVEAGLKGAGLKLFEWQDQMRVAPINASGKPVDVGALQSARIWDEGLWHLYQMWGLPKVCEGVKLAYFDPGKRASGEATLRCVGSRKLWDDKKKAVEVNRFEVRGVDDVALELWVDAKGDLLGGKSEARWMLRAKYTLEAGKEVGESEDTGDDEGRDAIKDRGVGE